MKKKHYIDYYSAVHWLNRSLIMVNDDIFDIDPDFEDPHIDDESGNPREIFQRFITDFTEDEIEWMNSTFPKVYFKFSDKLYKWILCVDHWGTAWDYVWTECNLDWLEDKDFNNEGKYEYKIEQIKIAKFRKR